MLDWITCLKTFQNIVTSGSFTKTAKNLYTTPSAISKRINWLEDSMGVPLFRRTTRSITLTEAGEALYDRSIPLLDEWEEVKQSIQSHHHEPNGILRLGVPIGFGSNYVVNMLPGFLEKYPNVKVDLTLTNSVSTLNNQQIDIYICHELLLQNIENFHKQPLMDIYNQLYAAPSYIEKYGKPKNVDDLVNHNCLTISWEGALFQWTIDGKDIPVSGNLNTNNTIATINAAVAGIGIISMCPKIIKKETKRGELVPLLPEHHIQPRKWSAYYPKQKFIPKKTIAFIEQMKTYLKELGCAVSQESVAEN